MVEIAFLDGKLALSNIAPRQLARVGRTRASGFGLKRNCQRSVLHSSPPLPFARFTASEHQRLFPPAANPCPLGLPFPVSCRAMAHHNIQYSEKYYDDVFEYRHVVLPPEIAALLPKGRLLSEGEWRGIGVQQSRGWVHYAIHRPEPHIMLFRRPKNYGQPQPGIPNANGQEVHAQ